MKKKYSLKILLLTLSVSIFLNSSIFSQNENPTLTKLFEDTYHLYELMRNDKGIYRDSKIIDGGNDFHPASVANIGVGLVSLCIADAMGWDANAADKATITLNSINGHTPGFTPERTSNGYFRHFINMETGDQEWNSEFSTIDTDILMIGAIICKNYFYNNSTITSLVNELWNSIDFTACIKNPAEGTIFLTMNADGTGGSNVTKVYNEYMLCAWLALNDNNHNTNQAEDLWNTWYSNPNNLPQSTYNNLPVLTDDHGEIRFLSAFTHQFNYYYINYFSLSSEHMQFYTNAKDAELAYWSDKGAEYEWGNGAGIDVDGYSANKINNNTYQTVSPHIIAGFIPIEANAKTHLFSLYNNNKGLYSLPDNPSQKTLWRYSLANPNWKPNSIQGIDQSTLLFGLASLPEYLGPEFFQTYNDLNYMPTYNYREKKDDDIIHIFPNLVKGNNFTLHLNNDQWKQISIYDSTGQLIRQPECFNQNIIHIPTQNFQNGLYLVHIKLQSGQTVVKKVIVE
ncbi:T9SS type A sorting domain-containing protein [Labilibacter sediminis]|nr:T9SS type A sorting domain-containing protein [Labilibacter sediminis]